jgi:hypothetical protein
MLSTQTFSQRKVPIMYNISAADPGGGGGGGERPPKIGKKMIFWRKIVIFHTKYPNNYRAFLRSAQYL